ncbi:hypothetical protein [Beggiatoa leptomitoformis]|uniref:Uncharacterized protein n=1 Tax=Beggiatoa leptomitoformis TaxID=288004 RepID=A0A2N9YFW7_9GAMM|nr:hypothetical protein [Beggiatoa leptomitoformis]ALG68404.1 hypothetical protein AL038_12695 [Beggiatoa leptomitoformis]AUI69269.1 hypothetical protein BLE401_11570 [Beggiatoa leptomitoformis]
MTKEEAIQILKKQLASLDDAQRRCYWSRVAHALTIDARGSYRVGTDDLDHPKMLRCYNELQHRLLSYLYDLCREDKTTSWTDEVMVDYLLAALELLPFTLRTLLKSLK